VMTMMKMRMMMLTMSRMLTAKWRTMIDYRMIITTRKGLVGRSRSMCVKSRNR
jgi:hypothetical protein